MAASKGHHVSQKKFSRDLAASIGPHVGRLVTLSVCLSVFFLLEKLNCESGVVVVVAAAVVVVVVVVLTKKFSFSEIV